MSEPIVLSDEEDEPSTFSTPCVFPSKKKPRTVSGHIPTVLVLDDDPTPLKQGQHSSTPLFIPETPISDLRCRFTLSEPQPRVSILDGEPLSVTSVLLDTPMSEDYIEKYAMASADNQARVSVLDQVSSERSGLICLESDNESDSPSAKMWSDKGKLGSDVDKNAESNSRILDAMQFHENFSFSRLVEDNSSQPNVIPEQVHGYAEKENENVSTEQMGIVLKQKRKAKCNAEKKTSTSEAIEKKKMTKEERSSLMEERKLQKEQEKLHKAALKAEAGEQKKMLKEMEKWEKGKSSIKYIVAEIDTKVAELGSVGGRLFTSLAEKGIAYRVKSNPIERSIVWSMTVPEHITQLCPSGIEIPYILLVYEADEFCDLVVSESLLIHVDRVRKHYPSFTVCYLTNRLMTYISKREKENYKNQANGNGWRRPPVEEVVAQLTTHFAGIHTRQCTDEAEVAEHVVGLTSSLASCRFRKKLTRLSVSANGSLVPKDATDRNLIKKSLWLKALIAIPKVQPRFAIAISKKYPTMKSLLRVYMDRTISEHEKEFLLKDLMIEGLLGGDKRVGEVCSKRVYRILMARSGTIRTDDVENGADFFSH